jgi:hypothetical protein
MHSVGDELKRILQRRVDWPSSFRLIPSRFPPVQLYEPIAPEGEWDALKRIETLTNPRLRSTSGLLLPEDEGKIDQNWLVAPFAYPDPEPSQYSDGSFGYSIVAESLHAALLVAVNRREAFLRRTAEGPTRLVMRVIKVPLKARLADLAHIDTTDSALRVQIGDQRAAKAHGVLVKGPRGKDDRLAVVLRPTAFVPPAVQAEHYCFLWNGERIHKLFAFPTETKVIDPKDLMASRSPTAA